MPTIIDDTMICDFIAALSANKKAKKYAPQFSIRKIANKNDIIQACVDCYGSGIPFQTGKQAYTDVEYMPTVEKIGEKIYEYFNGKPDTANTQDNYDVFFSELCEIFLGLNSMKTPGKEFSYGNAQKFVNMSFKYLSCYKDYSDFSDLFSYCHIPIDTNVLTALSGSPVMTGITRRPSVKYSGISWTQFNKETYWKLVGDYRRALSTVKGMNCWLACDYVMWATKEFPTAASFPTVPNAAPIKQFHK